MENKYLLLSGFSFRVATRFWTAFHKKAEFEPEFTEFPETWDNPQAFYQGFWH